MHYVLNASRVLYQTSKYAPVAVVQLELEVPTGKSFGLSKTQIDASLHRICAGGESGPLSLTGEGTPIEMYCDLALELQRYAGHPVHYSRAEEHKANHVYQVFIEYEDHATALYAGELAMELLNTIMASRGSPNAEVISRLHQDLDKYVAFALARLLDPNARLLMQAARRRDIPLLNLDQPWDMPTWPGAMEGSGQFQLGWGVHQQRFKGALPLAYTAPERLQQVADRAHWLPRLKGAGIPLANQDLEFINRNQVKRAQRSARRIGYPVTLRPRVAAPFQYRLRDNHVFGPIDNDEQVALVANHLREQVGVDVWVESHISGSQYHFLVLNGEMLSVVRCTPPIVIGDGAHTISELIQRKVETASDPASHRAWHTLARGDQDLVFRLQLAGFNLDSVPVPGKQIALRNSGTAYNGGNCKAAAQAMPAHFNTLAIQVAELADLVGPAGIDLAIADLSAPAELQNCVATDLTPAPDLLLHAQFSEADKEYITDKYLEHLFPAGNSSRIPTVAVTGTNGKTTTCRMVTRILQTAGIKVGLSCSDGVYLDNELLMYGDESGVLGANEVLADPWIEAAVLETARGNMANTGIAFDHCDAGACLNVAEDHLGLEGIHTLDEMAVHKRQVIERTSGTIVLNAEDPRCLAMQTHTDADEVILFAHSADHPAIQAHSQAGGKSIATISRDDGSEIVIVKGSEIIHLLDIRQIPATFNGKALFNVENAMAAVAISVGLDIDFEIIAKGLSSFHMTSDSTPGRLNIYDGLPFRVIVDYAHNAHGLKALSQFISQLEVKGQRIAVLFALGDRRDEDILNGARIVAKAFDYFICRDPVQLRDRNKGEITKLLQSALLDNGVKRELIETISDPGEAADKALSIAKPGDLLVIFMGNRFQDKIKTISDLQIDVTAR